METIPRKVTIQNRETLSHYKFPLEKITYKKQGEEKLVSRETYFPPDSATVLLYNLPQRTILLIRQFRLAAFVNGHATGLLLEACAGNIDKDETPETTTIREIKEEMGYEVTHVQKVFTLYSTPGSVTERLHYFAVAYSSENKKGVGGGLASENEEIETEELPFEKAYAMINSGEIVDAKTVLLLEWAKTHLFQ